MATGAGRANWAAEQRVLPKLQAPRGCWRAAWSLSPSLGNLTWQSTSLAGDDLDALTVNRHGKDFCASLGDGGFHARPGIRFN